MMRVPSARWIQRFASLVEQGLGQVPEAVLDQGWQRLAHRLAFEAHAASPILPHSRRTWAKLATQRGQH
jgi:hypothetical protein